MVAEPEVARSRASRRLIADETAFFLFRLERGGAAEVGLVGEDDHELRLFTTRGMLGDPGSDLAQGGSLLRAARLADGARRSNCANYSCHRSGEEKETKNTP